MNNRYPDLTEKILSTLKPYPIFTTIGDLAEELNVAYITIHFRLMELVAERKVGVYRKSGCKFFHLPIPLMEAGK